MPTAWHNLGLESICCKHMLNHLHINFFFPLGRFAERHLLHTFIICEWRDGWIKKKMQERIWLPNILFHLKIIATTVIFQNFTNVITSLARGCIYSKKHFFQSFRSYSIWRGIQELKCFAELQCFCHLCDKEV